MENVPAGQRQAAGTPHLAGQEAGRRAGLQQEHAMAEPARSQTRGETRPEGKMPASSEQAREEPAPDQPQQLCSGRRLCPWVGSAAATCGGLPMSSLLETGASGASLHPSESRCSLGSLLVMGQHLFCRAHLQTQRSRSLRDRKRTEARPHNGGVECRSRQGAKVKLPDSSDLLCR